MGSNHLTQYDQCFQYFQNCGDSAKWYCIGDNSTGLSRSFGFGLFDKLQHSSSTTTCLVCSLSIASRTAKKDEQLSPSWLSSL